MQDIIKFDFAIKEVQNGYLLFVQKEPINNPETIYFEHWVMLLRFIEKYYEYKKTGKKA
jgi:hypothetical protein